MRKLALALLCAGFYSNAALAQEPHPRLILTSKALSEFKNHLDPALIASLEKRAQGYLKQGPPQHEIKAPDSLLDEARKALAHIPTYALLYRLKGERKWLEQARSEMLTVAAFPDWDPPHFLDVAEMTTAMSFGYDWLYGDLSEPDRKVIRQAIVDKGLKAGLIEYQAQRWWSLASHNWALVCNGGLAIGALAVEEDEPELSRDILKRAMESARRPMKSFAPDGGWAEGPMYWAYATRYAVWMIASLQSAKGDDQGLSQAPGFAQTGLFALYSDGPCHQNFNFADAENGLSVTPQLLWFDLAFHLPVLRWEQERRQSTPTAFDLIWSQAPKATPAQVKLPLDKVFQGVNVGFFRSSWEDPDGLFLGFKGGDNRSNHGHLDLGTFVLQSQGQIWALDLGPDDYGLPGYFKPKEQRYSYYRLSTRGHNTVTFGDANQQIEASAPLENFSSLPERAQAVVELGQAYGFTVRRGFALVHRKTVVIQDEFASPDGGYTSGFLTRAEVELDGPRATLRQGGKTLSVRIVQPATARLKVIPAGPTGPGEEPNMGVHKLCIQVPEKAGRVVWEMSAEPSPALPVHPLSDWR